MNLDFVILGASGYGGGELLRWLSAYPGMNTLRGTARTKAGEPFWKTHPNLRGAVDGTFEAEVDWRDYATSERLVVFSALPHGSLAQLLPGLEDDWQATDILDRLLVVDLSGDFRLKDAAAFAKHYKGEHPCPEHLERFTYGLPEWNRENLSGAKRIASAGCFATALQLALLPLQGLDLGFIAASASTGSSGSGANPSEGTHHPGRAQDFRAYKVLSHQHLAEVHMAMEANDIQGAFSFVPHSAPLVRGIFATLQFPLVNGLDAASLKARLQETYKDSPFVRIVEDSPRVAAVAGSNYCDIACAAKDGSGAIMVAIDNLGKGMASQAIQCMNLALGMPETTGIRMPGRFPG